MVGTHVGLHGIDGQVVDAVYDRFSRWSPVIPASYVYREQLAWFGVVCAFPQAP